MTRGGGDNSGSPAEQEKKRPVLPALNTALLSELLKIDKTDAAELAAGPLLVKRAREIIAAHDREASSYPDTAGFTCGCQYTCEPLEAALESHGLRVRR